MSGEVSQACVTRWEYKQVIPVARDKTDVDILNEMGPQGWELVSVVMAPWDHQTKAVVLYFKRPLP